MSRKKKGKINLTLMPKATKHQSEISRNAETPTSYRNNNGCHALYQVWDTEWPINDLIVKMKLVWPDMKSEQNVHPTTGNIHTILKPFVTSINFQHWSSNGSIACYGKEGDTRDTAVLVVENIIKAYKGNQPPNNFLDTPLRNKPHDPTKALLMEKANTIIQNIHAAEKTPAKKPLIKRKLNMLANGEDNAPAHVENGEVDGQGDEDNLSSEVHRAAIEGKHPFHAISAQRFYHTFNMRLSIKKRSDTNWDHRLFMLIPLWYGLTEGVIMNRDTNDNIEWMHAHIISNHKYLKPTDKTITWINKSVHGWLAHLENDMNGFKKYYHSMPKHAEHRIAFCAGQDASMLERMKQLTSRIDAMEVTMTAQARKVNAINSPIPYTSGNIQLQLLTLTNSFAQYKANVSKKVDELSTRMSTTMITEEDINDLSKSMTTIKEALVKEIVQRHNLLHDALNLLSARTQSVELHMHEDTDKILQQETTNFVDPTVSKRPRLTLPNTDLCIETMITKDKKLVSIKLEPTAPLTKDSFMEGTRQQQASNATATMPTITINEQARADIARAINSIQSLSYNTTAAQSFIQQTIKAAEAGTFQLADLIGNIAAANHTLIAADQNHGMTIEHIINECGEQNSAHNSGWQNGSRNNERTGNNGYNNSGNGGGNNGNGNNGGGNNGGGNNASGNNGGGNNGGGNNGGGNNGGGNNDGGNHNGGNNGHTDHYNDQNGGGKGNYSGGQGQGRGNGGQGRGNPYRGKHFDPAKARGNGGNGGGYNGGNGNRQN
jgi:hypothetical protein